MRSPDVSNPQRLGMVERQTAADPTTADLAQYVQSIADVTDDDYWSFTDRSDRDFLHGLFRYPAMMVPRLQRELLDACLAWNPNINSVYDPFVGSGTVMTETMLRGRDFWGTDVNPLAILTCRAKSDLVAPTRMRRDYRAILRDARLDHSDEISVRFQNAEKWFTPGVLLGLSRLQRAIIARDSARSRRFWWAVLAEVVRVTSNSRTSTSKLHIRPLTELTTRPDPIERFSELGLKGLTSLEELTDEIKTIGYIDRGRYTGKVHLQTADSRNALVGPADMLMSSPPYGDNHTTVTYGQASYLPLQWIPFVDVERGLSTSVNANTHSIDTASLGGRLRRKLQPDEVLDKSPTLRLHYDRLSTQPRDRQARVLNFFCDMDDALDRIANNLAPGAPMIWTLGNRSVGGERIPLDVVITQLLGARAEFVTKVERSIPASRKRMPSRNATTGTMTSETIQILRRTTSSTR